MIAMPKVTRPFDIVSFTFKEMTMESVRVYAPFDFERAVSIVSECLQDLTQLLGGFYRLDQAQAAFAEAKHAREIIRVAFKIE